MKRLVLIAAVASALCGIKIAANPEVRRPVKHFISYYRQQDGATGILPRAVFSLALTQVED